MAYRCKHRLSDNIVIGASIGAAAGVFDDADHGTTIEFAGFDIPETGEKIYDDTPSAEKLDPNLNYKTVFKLTATATDTDGDGIADIAADNVAKATINIQKVDKDGNDITGAGDNEAFMAETSVGALDVASGSLVNGAATIELQPSSNIGSVARIAVRQADVVPNVLRVGSISIKFR